MSPFTKGGGFFLCLCFGGETGCLENTVEGLCVLLQNPACSHTCVKRSTSVCVCFRPSCQTAAISVSHTGRQAGKARQSFEVLFSPESSIRPEKTCHVVPPFRFQYGGGEGKDVCSYLLPTPQYTLGCSRPVKLRNLFDLAVNSSSYLFLSLLWDRSRPSSCSPILDRAYFIIYPSTSWLVCSAFCQIFFHAPSKSADHSFLCCSKFAISPFSNI